VAISLSKGGNVSLTKEVPGLKNILVGLGWDARSTDGADFDLDASCFMLGANGKVRKDSDFIFYNNLKSDDGAVEHTGDNRVAKKYCEGKLKRTLKKELKELETLLL
jgi:tellurium resistance protein TerD